MLRKPPRIPLHIRIARQLRREIARSRKTGDRLDSELALAKRFETSVLTVREALSALAEQGIVDRRQGSGTYVLDPLARQHVALFIDLDIAHPRTSYFHLRVIQQLRQIIRAAGYRTRLYMGETQPGEAWDGIPTSPEFMESINAGDLCGVVAISTGPGQWFASVQEQGIPVVGSHRDLPCSVGTDDRSIITQGAERLILHGRRKLAYIGWGGSSGQQKLFEQTLERHQVPFYPEWFRGDLHPSSEGAGWEEFREIWLGRAEKPDGLVIADDMLLPDAAAAILDLDVVVPDQLMIVSHRNRGSLVVPPFPVDAMEFDPDMVAAAMGDRLLRMLRHEPVDQPHVTVGFQWRLAEERPHPKRFSTRNADREV